MAAPHHIPLSRDRTRPPPFCSVVASYVGGAMPAPGPPPPRASEIRQFRAGRSAYPLLAKALSGGRLSHGPGAITVPTPWPAAGPALAFLQLLLGPADTAYAGRVPLGILDPTDELITGQRRNVLPGTERPGTGHQRVTQVLGKLVYHSAGQSIAGHGGRVTVQALAGRPPRDRGVGERIVYPRRRHTSWSVSSDARCRRGDESPGAARPGRRCRQVFRSLAPTGSQVRGITTARAATCLCG
jgi:hypothetical protein